MNTNRFRQLVVVCVVAVAALTALVLVSARAGSGRGTASVDRVERGRYLVTVAGCHDCHTPWKMGESGPEPDMSRMLSGHPQDLLMPSTPLAADHGPWSWVGAATNTAFAGPWGVSFAANLTPDENTGIGVWTEETFIATLRTGRHWGQSRPLLPPMPWTNFAQMTDEDLQAVYAYLRTLPPIHNRVPEPILPGAEDLPLGTW